MSYKKNWGNPDVFAKKDYSVCNVLAVYCFDDDQREIHRRLSKTEEHFEVCRCEALLRDNRPVTEDLAERWAKAVTACNIKAADICDEVLAESRAREAAAREEAKQKSEAK